MSKQSYEFDLLYAQAQEFIQKSDDQEKIKQLLDLLDEDKRSSLLQQYHEKTERRKQLVNFTQESFKKYENIKIQNFVQMLSDHNLPIGQFGEEVQNYFYYHTSRKNNVISSLKDQFQKEKIQERKIIESQQREKWFPPAALKNKMAQGTAMDKKSNPLLALFLEHLNRLKRELRQRKTLTMLQNVKSTRIKADQIEMQDLN